MANKVSDFYPSMDKFIREQSDNFGACLSQTVCKHNESVIECRVRLKDNKACLIAFYPSERGYNIFEHSPY